MVHCCDSCFCLCNDAKKRYYIIWIILSEICRIGIACGLCIFVPQRCVTDTQVCTLYLYDTYCVFVLCRLSFFVTESPLCNLDSIIVFPAPLPK